MSLATGTILRAKYEITGVIGCGGMSTVYKARDYQTGRELAIKDVERSGTSDHQVVVQSLAVEGRMLMQLDNPHLPKIHDIIEDTDSFLLVMDYVEGESLDRVCRRGRQSEADTLRWGKQICDVLAYLHGQNPPIIYRDMKPANVILRPEGDIMLIDFGTARTQKIGQDLRSDTICIGTDGFAAPEQYGGLGESDARTDLYCLGVTFFNLLTGHSPCDPPKGLRPLPELVPELEKSPFNYVIEKCTQKDPANRYQTAAELRADLEEIEAGTFRNPATRGKTFPFSGGLRRNGWQSLHSQGSGELGAARSAAANPETPAEVMPWHSGPLWRSSADVARLETGSPPGGETAAAPPEMTGAPAEGIALLWRRLMLAATLAAVLLLAGGALAMLAARTLAGGVLLILACAGAVLAAVGVVGYVMTRSAR